MKRTRYAILSMVLVALLILPGCIVRSVHSWVQNEALVFEEDLLGGWVGGTGDGETLAMTFVRGADNSYIVQYSDKESHGIFQGKLAKFGTDYYMDFRSKESPQGVDGMLLFPMHTVARMEIGSGQMTLVLLNYDEMKSAARMDRLRDLHYTWEDDELLITSSSSELQAFLLSLDRNSKLYSEPIQLARRK